MAAVVQSQVSVVANVGDGEKVIVYKVLNITTADTIDLSSVGVYLFTRIKAAVWVPAGGNVTTGVVATLADGASGKNTKAILTLTSMQADTIYLMVIGE